LKAPSKLYLNHPSGGALHFGLLVPTAGCLGGLASCHRSCAKSRVHWTTLFNDSWSAPWRCLFRCTCAFWLCLFFQHNVDLAFLSCNNKKISVSKSASCHWLFESNSQLYCLTLFIRLPLCQSFELITIAGQWIQPIHQLGSMDDQ
jgi:hypothetical protein